MDATADSVLRQALKLPEEDRAEIATRLIASLDADSHENRDDVEEAWAAEIERRSKPNVSDQPLRSLTEAEIGELELATDEAPRTR
jgi:hypothetical protein